MAQKGSNKRKQAPAYSADTMALRYMAGLALIALGAMIFMAVVLRLSGNIFEGLRRVCFGIFGILAYALPVLPLWAGGLIIWSTQKKAPVRPWLYAFLAFFGLCALMMITGAMSYLDRTNGGNWGGVIHGAYTDSATRLERAGGGGAAGAILAWPLWKYLGTVLGTLIVFLLTLLCVLLAVNLTPSRIRDIVTGQAGKRRDQQESNREWATQQQVAWQQQQAAQQAAWQQQQVRIIEQQQPQQYMQPGVPNRNTAAQGAVPQQEYAPNPGYGTQVIPDDGSVRNWQEQTATGQLVAGAIGHQSRIFGKKNPESSGSEESSFRSKIFGRGKKDEYDGLVGPDTRTAEPSVQKATENNGRAARKTATGQEINTPHTHWTSVSAEEEAYEAAPAKRTTGGTRRPPAAESEQAAEIQTRISETQNQSREGIGRRSADREQRGQDAYRKPSEPEKAEPSVSRRERQPEPRPAEDQPVKEKPPVPAVQQKIKEDAYKPQFKGIPDAESVRSAEDDQWTPVPYNYPPITDLAPPKQGLADTTAEDEIRSRKLEETLANFKVQARVVNVTHGPAISRFEMELAAGTKVNKVSELEKDIAYGMEATSVRIEAPIPGKSLVGVEVPNRKVTTVTLREVMESDRMQNAKSLLTVALGKDIAGTPIVCDLAKMPHMLIAGQTGSGKSVCINAIINSLLYRASPDEVKLILVDPKVVELQCYNGIPHLLIPVVNDPHKAAAALAWAVAEMMERYDQFAERKVRNLDGYNNAIGPGEKPMARIVIIIDELADLMMVCKKDVEEYICRLTQLARAAGIHLIVATQRPSVDVITGLIKANIPSRIAFKTASYVDSRTILDRNGAEQLLGWGDMLYSPTGSFAPTRVQGCFLSDDEVNRIVNHVRAANPSSYDPDILEKLDQLASGGGETGGADVIINSTDMSGGDGGLFEQAVEFAIADGQISTSTLQRRLKIGYARAGRLTDEMEERGIVAAKDGSKPRKCLITREEWEEMKQATEG